MKRKQPKKKPLHKKNKKAAPAVKKIRFKDGFSVRLDLAKKKKRKPSPEGLVFGTAFTDHIFAMDWNEKKGWHDARIVPYAPFPIEPAMSTLHYAQSVFEGMKAYRWTDGTVALFRPDKNMERLNQSCRRICIPEVPVEHFRRGLHELLKVEKDWIPQKPGTSLYIRPFAFASEPFLGVRPARTYTFMIIVCPVGAYYSSGFSPVKILVDPVHVRAAKGGTGNTKASGNYAASLLAAEEAHAKGYTQVLWLDAAEHKYAEEVGTMNIAFVMNGEVVTPDLSGSILPGVTRDTVLSLTRHWGIPTKERPVSIYEVLEAAKNGQLQEVFGTGTAAVISSVGELRYGDREWRMAEWKPGPLSQRLFDEIQGIQYGQRPDIFGWIEKVG